ncbi:MAG: hypothetical protein RSE36_02930 [Oscillospiraceae bacterium]
MLRFSLCGTKIAVSIWFAAFIAVMLLNKNAHICGLSLIFMLSHELAHVIAMMGFKSRPKKIEFMLGRIKITAASETISDGARAVILLAGPALNLMLFYILVKSDRAAAEINRALFLLNMLPAGFLDGGQLSSLFFHRFFCKETAECINNAITALICAAILGLGLFLLVNGRRSPSLLVAAIYISASSIKNIRYTKAF